MPTIESLVECIVSAASRAKNLGSVAAAATLHRRTESNRVDIEEPKSTASFRTILSKVATESGRSTLNLLGEIALLRHGKGCLTFDEYVGLRLFDTKIYGGADKRAFVGLKASQQIWFQANYRLDRYGLVQNKIASNMLFAAHGFPILPTIAMLREGVGRQCPFLLRGEEELRAFLTTSEHYPLFGKPIGGYQSIGSISLDRYDPVRGCLITTTGPAILLDSFIAYAKRHAASGYLFQQRVSPHAAVREICGDRLATVRLLTIVMNGQPRLLRACWKIPAGINVADNFWRSGNLLAQVDCENGYVLRVASGIGLNHKDVTQHPDTGARIAGIIVPNWQAVTSLAIEAAKILEDVTLVGWDIAPVDSGAVIVEANVTPDFKLNQLADRRGILDPTFKSFLMERKSHAPKALRLAKKMLRLARKMKRS
jgi:hypothetical protein